MSSQECNSLLAQHEQMVKGLCQYLAGSGSAKPGQGSDINVMQTHISTVILAGDFAYKIKKPLCLPFLDFSSLESRRHFCLKELDINRRTASELYLDVLPVTGSINTPQIDGQGPVIDWLVKMRRFDSHFEFSVLAREGKLAFQLIESLALHLAHFHAALPRLQKRQIPSKTTLHWVQESFDEIKVQAAFKELPEAAEWQDLRQNLENRFNSLAGLREQRISRGFFRPCHGDLHLGNIVLWQNRVMAFDALEFDEALRNIDIVNDIAFTFMDLLAAGLSEAASRFVNIYMEESGDYEGLLLLPVYAAYRALVRAKILLMKGDTAAFSRYWGLAKKMVNPAAGPQLVLVSGLSGSGKSTVAQLLADYTGGIRIRSDVERKRLYKTMRQTKEWLYSAQASRRTYSRLLALAQTVLEAGYTVIVDAVFLRHADREQFQHLATRLGVPFKMIGCMAPEGVMKERIVKRAETGSDPSDATPAVLDSQIAKQEPVPVEWQPFTSGIVNDGTLADLKEKVQRLVIGLP
ncbi:MAG: AAA family ATPase [Alcaligenaceae bacterium]|nr:AAA family ATPase [Alcaligenaceae bacterium]